MDDEAVLSFIRAQAAHARFVFSVCTGAQIYGAAGLLQGVRATTPPFICSHTSAPYPARNAWWWTAST